MVIRGIQPGDEPLLMRLGAIMWEESDNFRKHPLSGEKLKALAVQIHSNPFVECFVAEADKLIGIWVGTVHPLWYSEDLVCTDVVLYVHPHYRGTSAAIRLMRAAETWAMEMGAKEFNIGLSSGIDTEKTSCFFEKMGYTLGATQMTKEMGNVL